MQVLQLKVSAERIFQKIVEELRKINDVREHDDDSDWTVFTMFQFINSALVNIWVVWHNENYCSRGSQHNDLLIFVIKTAPRAPEFLCRTIVVPDFAKMENN